MEVRRKILLPLTLVALTAGAVTAWRVQLEGDLGPGHGQPLPPLATEPVAVLDLLYAQPFHLARPATHHWRAERPPFDGGTLLVLAVDPARVLPRETVEPVLYVGRQTAQRVNKGHLDGALVVVVPGEAGGQDLDLAAAPIWFGAPELPERIDAAAIEAQLERALRAGIAPFGADRVAAARRAGGAPLDLGDAVDLEQHAARLVLRYAPSERDLAAGLLLPRRR